MNLILSLLTTFYIFQGVQAIVFCGGLDPCFSFGPQFDECVRYGSIASRLLAIAGRAQLAGVGQVQKVVQVSRTIPWADPVADKLRWSSILNKIPQRPLPLISTAGVLLGAADPPQCAPFREVHTKLEDLIRQSGFPYVIVRAPPILLEARTPCRCDILLLQVQCSSVYCTLK